MYENELICNNFEAQNILVYDSLEVPSIKINGVIFNGEVSGGVTLPYLDSNYVKKADAVVLQDITTNASDTIFSKKVNTPEVVSGKVTASDVYSTMQNPQNSSVTNIQYCADKFPLKIDVYTKTASDTISALKLDKSDFNAFQQSNASNLTSKANVGDSYLKSQTDSLLSNKVNNDTFGSYQATVTTNLAGKLNNGDAYTKNSIDNLLSGKLAVAYQATNDAAVNSKVSQFAFDNYVASNTANLSGKPDAGTVYTKSQVDNIAAGKVDNAAFSTFQTSNSGALNQRVLTSDFTTYQTANSTALNGKVSTTDFGTYQMSNTAALNTKYNVSDFNTFNSSNNTALGLKVNTADYNTYVSSNNLNVGNRVLTTEYNDNKTAVSATLNIKANKTDVYTKTETDAKDSFIQSSLDSYKTSNDLSVGTKLDVSVFNSNKISTDTAIGSKVNQTSFDSYKTSNDASVNLKASQNSLDSYISSNNAAVSLKQNTTDFNTFVISNNSVLAGKQPASAYLSSIDQNLSKTDSVNFNSIDITSPPSNTTSVTTKSYVDTSISNGALAGTGLTKSGSTFSVNASQPQITSVGTLTSAKVSGTLYADTFSANTGSSISIPSDLNASKLKITGGNSDQFLVANPTQNLFRVDGLTGSTLVLSTTDSISSTTGAFQVVGGVGISKSLTVLGLHSASGAINILNTAVNGATVNAFGITTGALTVAGDINILHTLSPKLCFAANGVLEPSYTTRSKGTRIVLCPALTTTSADFAIGISSGTVWTSVPGPGGFFRWYGGTSLSATLSSEGNLSIAGSFTTSGLTTLASLNISGATNMMGLSSIGASSFKTTGDLSSVDFCNSAGTYGVRIKAGVEQGVGAFADFVTFGTGDTPFIQLRNNGSKMICPLPTTFNAGITQDIFSTSVMNNVNTATYPHARSYVVKSSNLTNSTFDQFELRDSNDVVQLSTSYFNGITRCRTSFFAAGGQILFGDGLQSNPDINAPSCGAVNITGSTTTAKMTLNIFNNGSTTSDVFRVLTQKTPGEPLLAVSNVDGSLYGGTNSTGYVINRQVLNSTAQTGVAFTKTTDTVNYIKSSKLVNLGIQFVTSAATGTASSGLQFVLPFACAFTGAIDNAYILRNGNVTNARLSVTTGSTTVTLTTSNGVGGFSNPSVQADSWYILFNYISQ